MHLCSLHLENFRNYRKFDFQFPQSDLLILEGKNGEGKSNFLEAIYLLALTKSFRTNKSENIIQWGKDFFRVQATAYAKADNSKKVDHIHNVEIMLEQCFVQTPKKQKAFKKNNVIIPREKFIGHLRTVLFRPEDLNMFIGEPALRRQYLNNIFIQTNPAGLTTLQNYQTILKQRNTLLQEQAKISKIKISETKSSEINIWNERLAQEGKKIQDAREEFIKFLQSCLPSSYSVSYSIPYSASESLKTALEKSLKNDLRFGYTTVGPHREDLKIFYNGHDIAQAASRGELRRLIISFKKAERDFLQLQTGENPILLLDDIFSELDSEGKEEILNLIPASQAIMTVVEGNTLPKLKGETTVRRLHNFQNIS